MALDDDPVLSFFLFDHPGLAGGGATPRTQSKEAKPSTGKTPAVATAAPVAPLAVEFTPKAFAGLYKMDVSSLLAAVVQSSSKHATSCRLHDAVHRLLLTPGQRQSETIRWNASITLLCGRFDSLELVDAIRFGALTAEVRDRDLKQEETLTRYQLKWESLYATGVDPGQLQQDSSSSILSSRSTPRSSDTSQPQTPSTTPAPATKPMDLSAVDDIARSDWRMMLANSDRLFPYGLARFRLVELLNTAKQSMGATMAQFSPIRNPTKVLTVAEEATKAQEIIRQVR
ncbi:hypothetical protein PF004_g5424 [Phytophthora fragariae]|uniref:Uncharacterized protein n=3 Tax=Phytophthora TaxID=4783 RepID=A0A6G0PG28_9STRA|nr:hypothetical protein PF004_g5424 [Phytophthora fragariae]